MLSSSNVLGVKGLVVSDVSVRIWISSHYQQLYGSCHHKIELLVFKRWIHQFWCYPCRTATRKSSISTVISSPFVVTSTSGTSISACSFIVLTDRYQPNALWRLFSVSNFREIVTQRTNKSEQNRANRTIRIARRLRIDFSLCFYRCSDSFLTTACQCRSQPSPRLQQAQSPPVGRESLEGDYSYFDRRHSVFQLVSSCFSIFRYTLLIDVVTSFEVSEYFFHLFGSTVLLLSGILVVSSRTLLACELP